MTVRYSIGVITGSPPRTGEHLAQAHEEADRGVGLMNADDLSGSMRRASRHKMLNQLVLLTGTERLLR